MVMSHKVETKQSAIKSCFFVFEGYVLAKFITKFIYIRVNIVFVRVSFNMLFLHDYPELY